MQVTGALMTSPTHHAYVRRRHGRGFSYRDDLGCLVTDARLRERFASLGIPREWNDVRIWRHRNGHIHASGRDEAGRHHCIHRPIPCDARVRSEPGGQIHRKIRRPHGASSCELRSSTARHLECCTPDGDGSGWVEGELPPEETALLAYLERCVSGAADPT
jgi:hypothetical protein